MKMILPIINIIMHFDSQLFSHIVLKKTLKKTLLSKRKNRIKFEMR